MGAQCSVKGQRERILALLNLCPAPARAAALLHSAALHASWPAKSRPSPVTVSHLRICFVLIEFGKLDQDVFVPNDTTGRFLRL